MRNERLRSFFCTGALMAGLCLGAARAEPTLTPIVADVLAAPQAVTGTDGHSHLVYELRLGNVTGGKAALQSLEVVDGQSGKVLATLDRDALSERLSLGGSRGAESSDLGPAQFGVLFIHVPLAAGEAPPKSLAHRLSGRFAVGPGDFAMTLAPTPVVTRPPIVLGRPLAGGGYVAADSCCDTIRHVRALLSLDGAYHLAQRFAIDWERIGDGNRLVAGDTKNVADYAIFGQPVLAVRDGVVVASRNDLPEQVPGALPAAMTVAEADGNFVVQDVGDGNFVLYAHMQPGSVTVKAGDRAKKGEVLGKVGNTGNSQAPHLHLHVMDGPSPLASNGLPYVFESFAVTAVDEAGTADFDEAEATGKPLTLTPVSPPAQHRKALPLDLTVVDFGP